MHRVKLKYQYCKDYQGATDTMIALITSLVLLMPGIYYVWQSLRFIFTHSVSEAFDSTEDHITPPAMQFLVACIPIFMSVRILLFIIGSLRNKLVLIIDKRGITFNPTKPDSELFEWEQISGISTGNIPGQKIITIHFYSPEELRNKEQNRTKRMLMKTNRNYKPSIELNTEGLDTNYDDLINLIQRGMNRTNEKLPINTIINLNKDEPVLSRRQPGNRAPDQS